MYIFPEMIDMGLKDDQSWPSDQHKGLAQTLYLCNPNITTRDHLTHNVQSIIDSGVTEDQLATFHGTVADLHKFCEQHNIIFEGVYA